MYYVYILKSLKDDRHYIGYTSDIEKRLIEHNRGKSRSVKNREPFKLIYKEEIESKFEAVRRERQIKKYKGGEALKKLLSKSNFDPIV